VKEATRPKNISGCRVKISWHDKTRAHAKPMCERPNGPEGDQTMIGPGNLGTGYFDPTRPNLQTVHFAQPLAFLHKPSPGSQSPTIERYRPYYGARWLEELPFSLRRGGTSSEHILVVWRFQSYQVLSKSDVRTTPTSAHPSMLSRGVCSWEYILGFHPA
jgi:hypothetical protein